MPWEGAGEKARPNTRLYYQVVLGTVDLHAAVTRLMATYADTRVERHVVRGEAVLAIILLDAKGRPAGEPATAVSSFGWGVPQALGGKLERLGAWQVAERQLVEGLDKVFRRTDPDGDLLPLGAEIISQGFGWLVSKLGVSTELVNPPYFAIRTYEYFKNPDPPEPILLNSFFLNDLAAAADHFRQNTATANLNRYFGIVAPAKRRDLLHDRSAIESAVAPERFAPARWPGPDRRPLVLLQQAAVNVALGELQHPGILAVNGPPGTGKTTLLRDIVAALVTERACAMAEFDDPADAFSHSGAKLRAGNAWLHLYTVDSRLRGFEMLVASSNNRAVENISAELPGLGAVAADAKDLRYFTTLSNALLERETWGLVAAVLGNAANRTSFRRTFWWDDDVGLSKYLAAAAGTPQAIEVIDQTTGKKITRPPQIVTHERAPRDHEDALKRWRQARNVFRAALDRSETLLRKVEAVRILAQHLPDLAAAEVRARERVQAAAASAARAAAELREAEDALSAAQKQEAAASAHLRQLITGQPGFLARLLRTSAFLAWREAHQKANAAVAQLTEATGRAAATVENLGKLLAEGTSTKSAAEAEHRAATDQLGAATQSVASMRTRLGQRFVDDAFFRRDHADRHRIPPWLDNTAQRTRDDVFVAAIALHKAFVDAAARPLRHNLGALMNAMSRRSLANGQKEALLPDLWASLFLVVPVVSTTFASVDRMLGNLPREALGWLLIDEAGQAAPQAAVGALMRTQRAVVVGDPMQIEPVVALPDTLTVTICRRFGVDPDRFNAPSASVQTLADAATTYVAEFDSRQGSRVVGVPLLVHRRCAEPMFGISNAIAYERLMVNAKEPRPSAIRDLIGPSRWFDIRGTADEKWCRDEGEVVLELLQQMARTGIPPDLYVITPFVVVQDNLRRLIRDSGVLNGWTDDPWRWTSERVGTVHVAQGREAEAVIFVLGATAPQQIGAREWAGGRPNLLNVAVTRAQEVLYVIGNRQLWRQAGVFRELDGRMPTQ